MNDSNPDIDTIQINILKEELKARRATKHSKRIKPSSEPTAYNADGIPELVASAYRAKTMTPGAEKIMAQLMHHYDTIRPSPGKSRMPGNQYPSPKHTFRDYGGERRARRGAPPLKGTSVRYVLDIIMETPGIKTTLIASKLKTDAVRIKAARIKSLSAALSGLRNRGFIRGVGPKSAFEWYPTEKAMGQDG